MSEYQVLPSSHTPIGRQPCSSWCANKGVAVHCHGYIFCQWNYPCSNGQVISEVQWTGHEDCVSLNCHFIGDITGKSWQSGQVKLKKMEKPWPMHTSMLQLARHYLLTFVPYSVRSFLILLNSMFLPLNSSKKVAWVPKSWTGIGLLSFGNLMTILSMPGLFFLNLASNNCYAPFKGFYHTVPASQSWKTLILGHSCAVEDCFLRFFICSPFAHGQWIVLLHPVVAILPDLVLLINILKNRSIALSWIDTEW